MTTKTSELTELLTPALADLLTIVDITADESKRITAQNFMKIVDLLTALTAPAAADVLSIYDDAAAEGKKITSINFMKVISLLTAASVAAADVFPFYDDDASAAKKITFTNLIVAILAALVNSIDSEHYVDGSIDKVHLAPDCIDGTKIEDDAVDSEHYADGSIDEAHVAPGAITNAKIGPDAVDDTKVGDAKIKKEHLNADVVGAGLTGGAGTALSVDGIVEAGSSELKVKVIDISDWNMDITDYVDVTHGLTLVNIRSISAIIRNDDNNVYYPLDCSDGTDVYGYWVVTGTTVKLYRIANKFFDGNAFDATSYNRGWVTIWYVA